MIYQKFLLTGLFFGLFQAGCASSQQNENLADICHDSSRSEWSTKKCAQFLTDERVKSYKAYELSKKMAGWFNRMKIDFPTTSSNKKFYTQNEKSAALISLEQNLVKRKKSADRTVLILENMGWRTQNYSTTETRLIPPDGYVQTYQNMYVRIAENRTQLLSNPDLIFPTITFKKFSEFLFVRPGLDSLPKKGEGWQLTLDFPHSFSNKTYIKMLSQGKFPYSWQASQHDAFHVVDFLEDPQYAKIVRQYFAAKVQFSLLLNQNEKIKSRMSDLDQLVNEFNFKVRPQNQDILDNIFGKYSGRLDKKTFIAKYNEFDLPNLAATLARVEEMFYELYDTFGAYARNGQSEHSMREIHNTTAALLTGKKPNLDNLFSYVNDDIMGHFLKAKNLSLTLNSPTQLNEFFRKINKKSLSPLSLDQFELKAQTQWALLLAQIEFRTRLGQEIPLSPGQMVTDLTQLISTQNFNAYRNSATYRFYSLVAVPGSVQRNALVEIAE